MRSMLMGNTTQRYATLLLAVFTVGALLLPFAHEFTHVRSLEHTHGRAAADVSQVAVGSEGIDAVDFYVEERTVPHDVNCDLCARLALDTPTVADDVGPFAHVDDVLPLSGTFHADRTLTSRQIRAPPSMS